ncbi:hypothetical protein OKW30_008357 [Paraburkholderia sp. Clong3]
MTRTASLRFFLAQKLSLNTARMNLYAEVLVHQTRQSLRSHSRLGNPRPNQKHSITAGVSLWPLRGPVLWGIKPPRPASSNAAWA